MIRSKGFVKVAWKVSFKTRVLFDCRKKVLVLEGRTNRDNEDPAHDLSAKVYQHGWFRT
jgi:hypothetical protein